MFVCVAYGGPFGHSGVVLTGLGNKSCYLHLTGSSYPKQKFAIPSHESNLTDRVCIPSQEDGNHSGISELNAFLYWQYYKVKTFNHPTHGRNWKEEGREKAINSKYSNENHNCSLFANRFLIAAACAQEGISTSTDLLTSCLWMWTGPIKTPRWFISRAQNVRDQVLKKLESSRDIPIYGYYLEEGVMHNSRRSCYSPESNISAGQIESIPYKEYTDLIQMRGGIQENVEAEHQARLDEIKRAIEEEEGSKSTDPAKLGQLFEQRRNEKKHGIDQRLDAALANPYRGMDPRQKKTNNSISDFHQHKWQASPDKAKAKPKDMRIPNQFKRDDQEANERYVKGLEERFKAHKL